MNTGNKERQGSDMKGIGLMVSLAVVALAAGCSCECKAGETSTLTQVAVEATKAVVTGVATSPAVQEIVVNVKSGAVAVANTAANTVNAVSEKNKGWGKEIGTMLREAGVAFVDTADGTLNVTQEHLERFSKSDAGKFTMFAIAWKLLGQDAIEIGHRFMGYLIGIGLLVGLTKVLWSINRRMTVGQMMVTSKKGVGPFCIKTWEFRDATVKDDETKGYIHLGTGIAQAILIFICCMIMF